jgi:hypothetical protein
MNIGFLIDDIFSDRDYERYGIDILLDNNIAVTIYDFRLLINIKFDTKSKFESDINYDNLSRYVLKNDEELDNIKLPSGIFLIDKRSQVYRKYTSLWFHDRGAIIVNLMPAVLPIHTWNPSIYIYLILFRNKFLIYGFKNTSLDIIRRFFYVFNKKQELSDDYYDIVVTSGTAIKAINNKFEIKSQSFDYDLFLRYSKMKEQIKKQIVFLDSAIVDHPDYYKPKAPGLPPIPSDSNKDTYYPLIRNFFNKVEEETGMQIVIALHPRLILDNDIILNYGNRKIVQNNSAELVMNSSIVIAHDSTAISFAALWKKPLIIITSNDLEFGARRRSMEANESILGTKRINIDKAFGRINFVKRAQEALKGYDKYIKKYIIESSNCEYSSTEILIKGLSEYSSMMKNKE